VAQPMALRAEHLASCNCSVSNHRPSWQKCDAAHPGPATGRAMNRTYLAGCIISDDAGRLLLLHRNSKGCQQWEIPGGKVENGERLTETAAREVLEETGVAVYIVRELGTRSFDQEQVTMVYTWFLANIISGTPSVKEPAIHDQCEYLSLASIQDMEDNISANTRNFLDELAAGRISIST
jgi:ADP-ribose pyrophosphatase YjhB (NUDIX family)